MSSQDDTSLNERLITAIRAADVREVKALIFKGVDVRIWTMKEAL